MDGRSDDAMDRGEMDQRRRDRHTKRHIKHQGKKDRGIQCGVQTVTDKETNSLPIIPTFRD